MAQWQLHERLEADTAFITDMPLCRVLLMDNALFPWIILVPRQPGLREITDISAADRAVLMEEIAHVSTLLQGHTKALKMNIAALGNMVPQLHIHIIARFEGDAVWPNPVWGNGGKPYTEEQKSALISRLQALFP